MSGSKSSSSSQTSSADNRQVVDGGSVGLSNSNSNVINITDGGVFKNSIEFANTTVGKVLQFASDAGEDASGNFKSLINSNDKNFGKVLDIGLQVLDSGVKQIDKQSTNLANAYQDAKGGSLQDKNIAMLGIGAAIVVALAFSRRA